MKKVKVLVNFVRLSVSDLIEFARNVVAKMTGNTKFRTPDVPLTQVTTAVNYTEATYVASQDGGRAQTQNMHDARKALEDLLYREADYVERVAAGNETIILSSGFNPTHQPKPADRPDFKVKLGKFPGSADLTHKAIDGAEAYIWQYIPYTCDTEATTWLMAGASTKAKFTIKNLQSGVKYSFRACGVTKDGMTPWCNPIEVVIQ